MDDLAAWYRAQLDEDERIVQGAGGAAWEVSPVSGWVHTAPLPATEWQPPGYDHHVASAPLVEDRAHIVAWSPARVLREIDAKRQLIALHREVEDPEEMQDYCATCEVTGNYPHYPCMTLRLLALPYSDRPGYRDDWRP